MKQFATVLLFTILGGIVYLLCAGAALNFNPLKWSEFTRLIFLTLELTGIVIYILAALKIKLDSTEK